MVFNIRTVAIIFLKNSIQFRVFGVWSFTIRNPVKKFISLFKGNANDQNLQIPAYAQVIPREKHCISRNQISANALKVLYRLKNQGYGSLLVGGSVRDLLLGREPKDFDVATNALPHHIKKCFRNGHMIGRRFRLVHIKFKNEIIEVSTFRAHHDAEKHEGMIVRDNVYGTFTEDAERRDFTVNALYYNIADFSVIDCHNGLQDIEKGILRLIGNPEERYREDPVRMLRAVRFAAKLGFRIAKETEQPITKMGYLLTNIPQARIFNEILKLFLGGNAAETFSLLRHYDLFKYLFPITDSYLNSDNYEICERLIANTMADTDTRLAQEKTVTPAYLFAAILWFPLQERIANLLEKNIERYDAIQIAINDIFDEQLQSVAIPRMFLMTTREIWLLQERMQKRTRSKIKKALSHPRFRAAYDFLLLRARSGEAITELSEWWQAFLTADEKKRNSMMNKIQKEKRKKKHD